MICNFFIFVSLLPIVPVRFSLWPYIRLLIVFSLVMPHFDGAYYVYKHLICPCLSIDPQIVFSLLNKRKESLVREKFLSEVERYVKENGSESLENLIACKVRRSCYLYVVYI